MAQLSVVVQVCPYNISQPAGRLLIVGAAVGRAVGLVGEWVGVKVGFVGERVGTALEVLKLTSLLKCWFYFGFLAFVLA
jgi:hypothetical protein